jgi:hypothetical protein
MDTGDIPRREVRVQGSAAVAGLTLANVPFLARAFPIRPGEEVIPWLEEVPRDYRPQRGC